METPDEKPPLPGGDEATRRAAQREFHRPLLVEAGAGTGKTATLVARVLAWTLGPGFARAAERRGTTPGAGDTDAARRDEEERIAAAVLSGVTAITFTEAAAAEMADRIVGGLEKVAEGERPAGLTELEADADAQARARALLAVADRLEVRTIHSFCQKLLAAHPFEAGVHPHFNVDADGSILREVVEETVEAALGAAYGEPGDADFLTLAARGWGPVEIADAVYELASTGMPTAALAEDPLAPAHREALLERLWRSLNRLQTLLEVRRIEGTRARAAAGLLEGLGHLRRQLRRVRRREPPALEELRQGVEEALPKAARRHLRRFARGDLGSQAEKERLAGAREQLMELSEDLDRLVGHVLALDADLLAAARRVILPLHRRVRRILRQRGALGFADLLSGAQALLAGHPDLAAQIRQRLDQLLVDEFQDTDRRQCDLVRRLALEGPAAERPGLFVVGDPKQSIYGWRNADLAAYEDFVTELTAAGGARLTLDENFRSTTAVLDEVERAVGPVMKASAGLQPEFRPLQVCERLAAAPGFEKPPQAAVEYWISWAVAPGGDENAVRPRAGTSRETAELEARALAADLVALHHQNVAWRDVGVLLRSLSDLEIYLAALREARIPFVVSRDRQYYRRREILDAAALVRAVLLPEDRLALLTVLRSSAVGVPDAALVPLFADDLPRRMGELTGPDPERLAAIAELARSAAGQLGAARAEVPGLAAVEGWENNLIHAAETLAALRRSFREDAVDVFVERLRRATLFEAGEAARYLGVYRRANLERFFNELLAALSTAGGDRHRVLRTLRRRIAEDAEAEEARPGEAQEDAVRVSTIHKAKGLEFPHVYLLETHKEAGRQNPPRLEIDAVVHLDREHFDREHYEYRLFGAATPGFDLVLERRQDVARAELVRTLYVALTRAGERLVIAGRPPLEGAPAPPERAATHLDLLRHRRGGLPSAEEITARWRQGETRFQHGDALFVTPGFAPLAAAPLAAGNAPDLPSRAAVLGFQARLVVEREAARVRTARPWRQVASKLGPGFEEGDETPSHPSLPSSPSEKGDSGMKAPTAAIAGSLLHKVLETFDLTADPDVELDRQRRALPSLLRLFATPRQAPAALERAELLFERLAQGQLLRRFVGLGESIVARELPVLLAPRPEDEAVGFLSGIVDLVYRDPNKASGDRWVVADFKTDLLSSAAAAANRARRYVPQGEVYTSAVREALGLAATPRFELWFLSVDHVEVLS